MHVKVVQTPYVLLSLADVPGVKFCLKWRAANVILGAVS